MKDQRRGEKIARNMTNQRAMGRENADTSEIRRIEEGAKPKTLPVKIENGRYGVDMGSELIGGNLTTRDLSQEEREIGTPKYRNKTIRGEDVMAGRKGYFRR